MKVRKQAACLRLCDRRSLLRSFQQKAYLLRLLRRLPHLTQDFCVFNLPELKSFRLCCAGNPKRYAPRTVVGRCRRAKD